MDLIEILKSEHQVILSIFADVDATGRLEEKQALLRKLMPVAIAHLNKEDIRLYPVFRKSTNSEFHQMADTFSATMGAYAEELSRVVSDIFAAPAELSAELVADYEAIRNKIKERIGVEEAVLFPAYEEILSSQ